MTIIRKEVIGNQTLLLGDCRDAVKAIAFDCVVTDPPYGMSFQSNQRTQKHRAIANDGDTALLLWACGLAPAHSAYVWMRWDNLPDVPKPKSLITWVKNNWSMGDLEHEHGRQTEVCAFYPGAAHRWGKGRPSDVIHCPRTGNEHHPTEKPVALMREVVEWTVGRVFDPFMGSGSSLVACERLGRPGVGVEIDPVHFETACKRVEEATRQPDLFIAPTVKPTQEAFNV